MRILVVKNQIIYVNDLGDPVDGSTNGKNAFGVRETTGTRKNLKNQKL